MSSEFCLALARAAFSSLTSFSSSATRSAAGLPLSALFWAAKAVARAACAWATLASEAARLAATSAFALPTCWASSAAVEVSSLVSRARRRCSSFASATAAAAAAPESRSARAALRFASASVTLASAAASELFADEARASSKAFVMASSFDFEAFSRATMAAFTFCDASTTALISARRELEASSDSPLAFLIRPLNSFSSPSGTDTSPSEASLVSVTLILEGKPKSSEPLSLVRRVGLR